MAKRKTKGEIIQRIAKRKEEIITKLADIASGKKEPDFKGQDKYMKLYFQVAGELVDKKEVSVKIDIPEELIHKLAETLQHIHEDTDKKT